MQEEGASIERSAAQSTQASRFSSFLLIHEATSTNLFNDKTFQDDGACTRHAAALTALTNVPAFHSIIDTDKLMEQEGEHVACSVVNRSPCSREQATLHHGRSRSRHNGRRVARPMQ